MKQFKLKNLRNKLVEDDIYEYTLSIQGSSLDYEYSRSLQCIWILNLVTEPEFQNQGRAKFLLDTLFRIAQKTNSRIIYGAATEDGTQYLLPLIPVLSKKYNVHVKA